MSDGSSSSRDPSPIRAFRPHSLSSDAESGGPSRRASPGVLHPSSIQPTAPLLRQPVGFGANAVPPPTYHPSLSHAPPHHYPAEPSQSSKKKSSKGKEKEKSKEKSNSASRKGKERDKGTSIQPALVSSPYPPGQPHPGAPLQRTAFRVRAYANDPSATGSAPSIQEGPYGAAYRVGAEEETRSRSHANRQHAQTAHGATADTQPRASYYRYDYDKIRESAPANRAKQQAAGSPPSMPPSTHHTAPPQHYLYPHQAHSSPPAAAPAPAGSSSHSHSRSSKRKDTHMYPADTAYPSPQPSYGDTYDWAQAQDTTYFSPAPTPDPPHHYSHHAQPTHAPAYAASPPPVSGPAPSKEKRHKSRSHRHRERERDREPPPQYQPQQQYQHQQYPPSTTYTPAPTQPPPQAHPQPHPQAQPQTRVMRMLTLLIEDKRPFSGYDGGGGGEEDRNLLTEVRVPLRPADAGDTGMWADAQEVAEELQRGASRIDGRAKVYTLRGKYKQYFLRTSEDGTHVCQPANLKVTPERTLEIFIEDNPMPAAAAPSHYYNPHSLRTPSSPPRDLPTPSTDPRSMTSPSPAPGSGFGFGAGSSSGSSSASSLQLQIGIPGPTPPAEKRPSRSSLFSADDDEFQAPSPEEFKYDASTPAPVPGPGPSSSRKRQRSASVQSVQSARSQSRQLQQQHDAFSPFPGEQQHDAFSPFPGSQEHDAFSPTSYRAPSEMPVSAVQSRTSSVASQSAQSSQPQPQAYHPPPPPPPPPQVPPHDPGPMSPVSPFEYPDIVTPQPARTRVASMQHARSRSSSSFSQAAPSPAPSRAPSGSKPSPTKKTKLDRLEVPSFQPQPEAQPQPHTEYSVSPASSSRPSAIPFSDTRTTQRVVSGFEAYANKPPPTAFSGAPPAPPPAAPNPFARYRGDDSAGASSLSSFGLSAAHPKPPAISLPTLPMKPTLSPPSSPLLSMAASLQPDAAPPVPTTMPPAALTIAPTLSGAGSSELDTAVGKYIREIISKEPAWAAFVKARSQMLPVRAQLAQYRYVAGVAARFVGSTTPADLHGAGGVCVAPGQVVKAFNLKPEWWAEGEEILELAGMYGEKGTRGADARVVGMYDEVPPVTTGMQAKKFLKVLREVHAQWTMKRDG